ncbi:hypothetical protein [[Pseudomonas] boreopolis]|uniref:hypothetical protein n=1 Tax=Xanthomonas boreopolis TaxID=86183 RepID=UPI003DA17210
MMEKLGRVLQRGGLSAHALAWVLGVLATLVVIVLLSGSYARTDETRGPIGSGSTTGMGGERSGVLRELMAQSGQSMPQGQHMVRVAVPEQDSMMVYGQSAGMLGLQTPGQMLASIRTEAAQVREIHDLHLRSIDRQLAQTEQELSAMDAESKAVAVRLRLAESAHWRYQSLTERRDVSQAELDESLAEYQQIRAEYVDIQTSLLAGRQRLTQLRLDRRHAEENLAARLDALSLKEAVLQERIHAQQRERHTRSLIQ